MLNLLLPTGRNKAFLFQTCGFFVYLFHCKYSIEAKTAKNQAKISIRFNNAETILNTLNWAASVRLSVASA